MTGSLRNLRAAFDLADDQDIKDGLAAYGIYNRVIRMFADQYGVTFERALSAFVALSPNSDYFGNLRSLASVLAAVQCGTPCAEVTVSTYNHCRNRAYSYATGEALFLASAKGPKIRSFFLNVFNPSDPHPVTVDGHISCAWSGIDAPMKESIVRPRDYEKIASAIRRMGRDTGMIANQVQATIWMARKRTLRIKFRAQMDMFLDPILVTPADALPYPASQQERAA